LHNTLAAISTPSGDNQSATSVRGEPTSMILDDPKRFVEHRLS